MQLYFYIGIWNKMDESYTPTTKVQADLLNELENGENQGIYLYFWS